MKFLVVGASGFLGRHVYSYLKNAEYDCTGTQRSNKDKNLVSFDLLKDRIKDCLPSDFFTTNVPVVAVISAVISDIDLCETQPEISGKVNVDQTLQLIEDLSSLNVRIVYISSSWVFDGALGHYPEEHAHNPVNEYGKQKSAVEKYVIKNKPYALVLRLDKLVGNNPHEDHLFSEWNGWISQKHPLVCLPGQLMSPTFVDDVARAIVTAAEKNYSGLYNVSNTEFFSRDELARQFLSALGSKAEVVLQSEQQIGLSARRPLKTYLDSKKFIKAAGFRFTPVRDVFQIFSKTLNQTSRR